MMIHDFDMARWILGDEPVSIYSRGSCLVDPQIGSLGDSYRLEMQTFLRGVAEGTPALVSAIDGLRTAYLAEAAAPSLRLGTAIELKPNCEVTWHD